MIASLADLRLALEGLAVRLEIDGRKYGFKSLRADRLMLRRMLRLAELRVVTTEELAWHSERIHRADLVAQLRCRQSLWRLRLLQVLFGAAWREATLDDMADWWRREGLPVLRRIETVVAESAEADRLALADADDPERDAEARRWSEHVRG